MLRYIAKRVLLSLVTLWLLATIVFIISTSLPSDPARAILGNTADEKAVNLFRKEFGLSDPWLTRYWRSIRGVFTFDFGKSWATKSDAWDLISEAFARSAKLAILALLITVPIAIIAGLVAAAFRNTAIDRAIVLLGLATSSIPEFVTGALLAVIFGVKLGWFPSVSVIPDGTSAWGQLEYLILPALALAIVYFGYIARMMRAGAIRSLEADYTRTAVMKGLPANKIFSRHVLRNSLAPTITVISAQCGYLFGGIVGVELIFNYPGLGKVLLNAVKKKDLPVLTVVVLIVGIVYMVATLIADIIIAWLNPRARLELESS